MSGECPNPLMGEWGRGAAVTDVTLRTVMRWKKKLSAGRNTPIATHARTWSVGAAIGSSPFEEAPGVHCGVMGGGAPAHRLHFRPNTAGASARAQQMAFSPLMMRRG